MEEKSFRILLDVSELNFISFKYIWMNIFPRDLKTIGDLKLSILKRLGFDRDNIRLFVHDGLLLEEEKIVVLRENDTVKVQFEDLSPTSCFNTSSSEPLLRRISDLEKNFEELNDISVETEQTKKKKRKSSIKTCDCSEKDRVLKKRKRKSNDYNDDAEENTNQDQVKVRKTKKKQKCSPVLQTPENYISVASVVTPNSDTFSIGSVNQTNELLSNFNTVKTKNSKNKQQYSPSTSALQTPVMFNLENEEQSCALVSPSIDVDQSNRIDLTENASVDESLLSNKITEFPQGNNCKKKKRKRTRKRKSMPNLVAPFVSQTKESDSKKNGNFEPCDAFGSVRKHIRFTSPTPETSDSKHIEIIDIDSYVAKHKSTKCLKPFPNITECSPPTAVSPVLSDKGPIISTPCPVSVECNSWTVSPMLDNSSFATPVQISPTESGIQEYNTELQPTDNDMQNESHKLVSYKDYPVLNVFPGVGTRIAYKMLELDENYSPVVSDFKEGTVIAVNTNTQEIEIKLKEAEIKPARVGKFENLKDDEIPTDEVIKQVTINWVSLIDPRLIYSASN